MDMLNNQMVDFRLLESAKVGFWQWPSIGTHPISDRLAGSTMCFTENIWLKFRRLQLLLHLLPNWQVLALSGNAADMWWGQWGKEAKLTTERAEWRAWYDPLCVCDEINEGFPRFSPFVWSQVFKVISDNSGVMKLTPSCLFHGDPGFSSVTWRLHSRVLGRHNVVQHQISVITCTIMYDIVLLCLPSSSAFVEIYGNILYW